MLYEKLALRAKLKCELCSSQQGKMEVYTIQPTLKVDENSSLILCEKCRAQIENPESLDVNHWRCLNESMWSEYKPVQVMSYRMLSLLRHESWASELLEQMYLDEDLIAWAKAGLPSKEAADTEAPTFDSNGVKLVDGDSVTLIKDLDVKGGGFTAKRGTLVKNISLTNNPKHVEGKVNGIQIVLVSAFLKKA